MLPSFYLSGDKASAWSVRRAAGYGAALGAIAGLFKTLAPYHVAIAMTGGSRDTFIAGVVEIAGAALGFAVLCAGAAALRNLIAQWFISPEIR